MDDPAMTTAITGRALILLGTSLATSGATVQDAAAQTTGFARSYELPDGAQLQTRLRPFDANSDGSMDVISPGVTEWGIHLSDGTGRYFASQTIRLPAPYDITDHIREFTAADVDGDGDVDLVLWCMEWLLNRGPTHVFVALNDGQGRLTVRSTPSYSGPPLGPVVAGNVDSDPRDEIVGTERWNRQVRFLRYDSTGTFQLDTTALPNADWHDARLADVDGDGDPDFIGLSSTSGAYEVLKNDGSGRFANWFTFPMPVGDALPHDFDGDGDVDLVLTLGHQADGLELWLNDGRGSFSPAPGAFPSLPVRSVTFIQLVDLQADGAPEVYVNLSGRVEIWRWNGQGGFTDVSASLGLSQTVRYGLAFDADRDGDDDLLEFGQSFAPDILNVNTTRHLFTNDPTVGGTLHADVWGQPGELIPCVIGFVRQDTLLPGVGWLGIGLQHTAAWPTAQTIPTSPRQVRFTLPVPNHPRLQGVDLWAQALHLGSSGLPRLGNLAPITVQ